MAKKDDCIKIILIRSNWFNVVGLASLKLNLQQKLDDTEEPDTSEQPSFAPCIDGPVIVVESDDSNCVFFGNTQFVPRYAYAR